MGSLPDRLREHILEPLLALAFPPLCRACGAPVLLPQQHLCRDCSVLIDTATITQQSLRNLRISLARAGALDDVLVLYHFDQESPLQAMIHQLKYHGAPTVGRELGARLGRMLARELPSWNLGGVVPVPLHRARRRERGYNQACLVAEGAQSILALPILDNLLVRTRSTASQTSLSAAARSRNVAAAFAVREEGKARVAGGAFLLVDDVVTTGATLDACAQALKAAGALQCVGAAVAIAR